MEELDGHLVQLHFLHHLLVDGEYESLDKLLHHFGLLTTEALSSRIAPRLAGVPTTPSTLRGSTSCDVARMGEYVSLTSGVFKCFFPLDGEASEVPSHTNLAFFNGLSPMWIPLSLIRARSSPPWYLSPWQAW